MTAVFRHHFLNLTALAAALLFAGACPGGGLGGEVGADQCKDGRDNDGDTKIDCLDPDCHPLAFCSPFLDGGLDFKATPDKNIPGPDKHIPKPDKYIPKPDLPPASSYGKTCNYVPGTFTKCPDGQTICVPGPVSKSVGFCSHGCDTKACPPGPTGTQVSCSLTVGPPSTKFCLFSCTASSCPYTLSCYSPYCFPG